MTSSGDTESDGVCYGLDPFDADVGGGLVPMDLVLGKHPAVRTATFCMKADSDPLLDQGGEAGQAPRSVSWAD